MIFFPFLSTTTANTVVWPLERSFTRKTDVTFSTCSATTCREMIAEAVHDPEVSDSRGLLFVVRQSDVSSHPFNHLHVHNSLGRSREGQAQVMDHHPHQTWMKWRPPRKKCSVPSRRNKVCPDVRVVVDGDGLRAIFHYLNQQQPQSG